MHRSIAVIAAAVVMATLLAGPAAWAQTSSADMSISAGHPAGDYRQAAELFQAGRRDEATYWFYRGQYRYRVHLVARPGLEPSGDPALFASLNESLGRPINEWAFGDVPALAATLGRVLDWQSTNDDAFTPKAEFPAAHAEVRAGLEALRAQILAERQSIREQRRANGLANRN